MGHLGVKHTSHNIGHNKNQNLRHFLKLYENVLSANLRNAIFNLRYAKLADNNFLNYGFQNTLLEKVSIFCLISLNLYY